MKNYEFHRFRKKNPLPIGKLPKEAYKFREPNSFLMVNVVATLYAIPVLFLIIFLSKQRGQSLMDGYQGTIGLILSLIMIIPHELLHAICFPKTSVKHIYAAPLSALFFVLCTDPITKRCFIFLSLLPNIVLGFLPFVIWLLLPASFTYSQFILTFSAFNILCGCGDYMNVVHALLQMPKGSMQQLSGMNSYWFMPEDIK